MPFTTLFGPVPSRRFGRSLGIDLVPLKTCSLNCVFCQLGRTPQTTIDRKDYVPIAQVIADLTQWLETDNRADVLTLSGSGEPTLHAYFGQVLDWIQGHSSIPSLLLTNGSLFHLPEVRSDATKANMVKTSLCAWDQASFQRINRPHPDLTFDRFLHSQIRFRQEFSGQLILEVFLLQGMNDSPEQITALSNLAQQIQPDRIHLNTVERPPAESFARPVSTKFLHQVHTRFTPRAEIATVAQSQGFEGTETTEEAILDTLRRRPCTLLDLSSIYGLHQNEMAKYVSRLVHQGHIQWTDSPSEQPYLTVLESPGTDT